MKYNPISQINDQCSIKVMIGNKGKFLKSCIIVDTSGYKERVPVKLVRQN